jgi:ADP-heptose:LPS heptosyltransferase
MNKILISSYTGLGNFILKTPFIRAIKKEYPDCKIDLLCGFSWGVEDVLKDSSVVDKVYWLQPKSSIKEKHALFLELKKNNYNIVFLPFDASPRFVKIFSQLYLNGSKIISHFNVHNLDIKQRIKSILDLILFPSFDWVPTLKCRHETDLNFDLLQVLTPKPITKDYQTYISWQKEDVSHLRLPETYVVIQPSAANGEPTPKIWNPENFIELIKRWRLNCPDEIFVLVGDSGDALGLQKCGLLMENGVINLLGGTTFNQLCNVLNDAKIIVAHDSGIMHVANALKAPLVALYGPTDFTRTAPLSGTTHVLHSRNECSLKMYAFQGGEKDLAEQYPNYYCMSGITVDQVLSILNNVLNVEKV